MPHILSHTDLSGEARGDFKRKILNLITAEV